MSTYDPIHGKVVVVFFHYAIPAVLGMLAMSSAFMIDGIFLGNVVGAEALAAVNIAMPVWSGLFSLITMLSVGSSVIAGKYLGQRNVSAAAAIFSKAALCALVFALVASLLGVVFLDPLVLALGANETLAPLTASYLLIIFPCAPAFLLGFMLFYFVRIDNRPVLASASLILCALLNILLDWLFIVVMDMGIRGAAYGTGLSQAAVLFILLPHFYRPETQLKPDHFGSDWRELFRAMINGFSEFVNEISAGLTTLLLNWLMVTRLGVDGVAAFTIVNYLFFIGLMVFYGISESLEPLVSKNFGAGQAKKIEAYVATAMGTILIVAVLVCSLLLLLTDQLIGVFLKPGELETAQIARRFVSLFWPAFLFSGLNICLTAYFTACHKPLQSASIALSRSLLLPITFLIVLPLFFGESGIFVAVPTAELVTLLLAVGFFLRHTPARVVAADAATRVPQEG